MEDILVSVDQIGTAECEVVLLALQLAWVQPFSIMYSSKQNIVDVLISYTIPGFIRFLYFPLFSASFIQGTNNLPYVFCRYSISWQYNWGKL